MAFIFMSYLFKRYEYWKLQFFCNSIHFTFLESSEEKLSPAAERPEQDDTVEKSPEERPSPQASPSARPASDRSDSSSSDEDEDDDDSSSSDDEHVGTLRKIRSSVAQIRVR